MHPSSPNVYVVNLPPSLKKETLLMMGQWFEIIVDYQSKIRRNVFRFLLNVLVNKFSVMLGRSYFLDITSTFWE